ncbi:22181_t:CDS:1, partial [Racocetra persica]
CPQNDEDYNNSEKTSNLEKRFYKKRKHEPIKKQKHKPIKEEKHKPIKTQEHKPTPCKTATCTLTKTECVTPTPTCAPLSAPCNISHQELCCTGLCSTLSPSFGCCNPKGQPCPIFSPQ